jgi:TrmH family RNA methyltransferase
MSGIINDSYGKWNCNDRVPVSLLTLARDLKRRKARERRSLFVAEGVRSVEELLASEHSVTGALVTAALSKTERGAALRALLNVRGITVEEVSESDFASAADTENPQGVLGIGEIPSYSVGWNPTGPVRLLVLDAIQDPGNVGTLIRTAAALGAIVIALPGTADIWSAKAIRSAVGAQLRIPVIVADIDEMLKILTRGNVVLWSTAADGDPVTTVKPPERLAIAMGNEGAGVSAAVRAASERVVSLPMHAGVESLNVAVAAGITLFALKP